MGLECSLRFDPFDTADKYVNLLAVQFDFYVLCNLIAERIVFF